MKYAICALFVLFSTLSIAQNTEKLHSDFITDSSGCLGLRAKHIVYKGSLYIDDVKLKVFLKGKTKQEIEKAFGKPNKETDNEITYLIYNKCDAKTDWNFYKNQNSKTMVVSSLTIHFNSKGVAKKFSVATVNKNYI